MPVSAASTPASKGDMHWSSTFTSAYRHRGGSTQRLPVDAEAGGSLEGVAVAEIGHAGHDRSFAVDRVFVVGPIVAAAEPDLAPQPVVLVEEVDARDRHHRAVQELIVQVADAVEMAAAQPAVLIVPACLAVERDAQPAKQAVA